MGAFDRCRLLIPRHVMKPFLVAVFSFVFTSFVFAQTAATGIPYFQQQVHYTLAATFHDDAQTPSIDGTGSLEYTNNSPDTLHELYFHLYWNLFTNGSYGETAPERNHDPGDKYGHGGINIKSLSYAGSRFIISPRYEIDNTVMRVFIDPLAPGSHITLSFDWHGILPNYGIRST